MFFKESKMVARSRSQKMLLITMVKILFLLAVYKCSYCSKKHHEEERCKENKRPAPIAPSDFPPLLFAEQMKFCIQRKCKKHISLISTSEDEKRCSCEDARLHKQYDCAQRRWKGINREKTTVKEPSPF